MKKRFLCIMLVLLMASALLPAGAFAAEGGKALRRGTDGFIPCIGENGNRRHSRGGAYRQYRAAGRCLKGEKAALDGGGGQPFPQL